ncbi:MAG: hypothetical protein H6735_22460 [Alphaproteobacteria bacterium]|nr:hypothetical protein [Alphaproteobacteria bacterium]
MRSGAFPLAIVALLAGCHPPTTDAAQETPPDCVLPRSPAVDLLDGSVCDPWLAPEGLEVLDSFTVAAGTRIVFGAGTRFSATGDLTIAGTAASPVVLEAAAGERWEGLYVAAIGDLDHVVVRRTAGDGAIRTSAEAPDGDDAFAVVAGVTIEDADGVGIRIDGSLLAEEPVRFVDVTGPLVSSTGRGLFDALVEDGGGNAQPWIEIRGAEKVGRRGNGWGPQTVPIHVVSDVSLDATVDTDCCGYVMVVEDSMTVTGNTVLVASGVRFEVQGSVLEATDTTFSGLDGAAWGGFVSGGPERTYGYADFAALVRFERVVVRDAVGPIIDFSVDNDDVAPVLRDTVLGPVAGGSDVCVLTSACTHLDAPAYGNTLDCAVPLSQPRGCP